MCSTVQTVPTCEKKYICLSGFCNKGTGTRDLIWVKVVSLDISWLVGLTDDL